MAVFRQDFSKLGKIIALPRVALLGWRNFLRYRELKVIGEKKGIPDFIEGQISEEELEKSRLYKRDGLIFSLVNDFISTFIEIIFIIKFASLFWSQSIRDARNYIGLIESMFFPAIFFSLKSALFNFPIEFIQAYLKAFYLEEKHGFNNQSLNFFLKDMAKSFILNLFISSIFTAILMKSLELTEPHYIITTLAVFIVLSSIFLLLVPNYIMPLFDKFEPLQDSYFKSAILDLAKKFEFPVKDIMIQMSSMRSHHSNAYFFGFFTKRIVFFDTLLSQQYLDNPQWKVSEKGDEKKESGIREIKDDADYDDDKQDDGDKKTKEKQNKLPKTYYSNDEILAVLCHEIGHWHHSHNYIVFGYLLFALFLVLTLSQPHIGKDEIDRYFGIPSVYALRVFFVSFYVMSPILEVVSYAFMTVSRRNEYQADEFAAQNGYSDALISGLKKLFFQNKSYPYDDWLFSAFNHSHPTVDSRLKQLESLKRTYEN